MYLLHIIIGVLVAVGGRGSDSKIPWWNIRKLLSEVVNTGLGVDKLQEYFETGYQWQSEEIDGPNRLQKVLQRVSRLMNRSIDILVKLKRSIEQEYNTWQPKLPNNDTICCQQNKYLPNGCAVVNSHNRHKLQLGASPPSSVLRVLNQSQMLYPGDAYQYFAFEDGSIYVHPSIQVEELSNCVDYDPRLRYFYSQCKSPEPRDVVVVVHGEPLIRPILRNITKNIFDSLSLMDRVGLCLPGSNGCQSGSFGTMHRVTNPTWPGPDIPLGRRPILGRLLASNKKNKKQLVKLLDSWPDSSPTFPSHLAAVEAGLHFLNISSKHSLDLSAGVYHKVLAYITTMKTWEDNPHVLQRLQEAVHNGTSVVVNLIQEEETAITEGVILEHNNASLKIVHYNTNSSFIDYHGSIPSFGQNSNNEAVVTIPYWDAFGMGYIITICLPLMSNRTFVGSACIDAFLLDILADTTIHDIENAYSFVINSQGITLMHPLLPSPHSVNEDPATVTIDQLEQPMDSQDLLRKIIHQKNGREDTENGVLVEALGWPDGTNQPNAVRGKRASLRFLWASIPQTDLILVLVLPLTNGKVVSTSYKCFNMTTCETRNFHYHKSKPGVSSRSFCRYFRIEVTYDAGLVKFAPDCFNDMHGYLREEGNESISQIYSIFNGSSPFNELLRTDLRASVKLTETAVNIWKSAKDVRQYIGVQFMGTADGVFISFPGFEMKPTYDHRSRPWYQLSISSLSGDHLSMTTPHCNKYKSTMVYTLSRSLRSSQGTPMGVVAGDFTLHYIMSHFLIQVPDCKLYICLLVDFMGYVVLKTDWSPESLATINCDTKTGITAAHLIKLVPDIARDMINSRLLRRRGCHDYERDITFYYWWLNMRGHKTLHKGDTYEVHKILSTNLYFVVGKQGLSQDSCICNPYQEEELMECHDTCEMECECPCKAGPNTQPCHNPESDIHSYRQTLPACKPSDPSHPSANNFTREELQELRHCHKCDGQEEKECKRRVSCEWKGNNCSNYDAH